MDVGGVESCVPTAIRETVQIEVRAGKKENVCWHINAAQYAALRLVLQASACPAGNCIGLGVVLLGRCTVQAALRELPAVVERERGGCVRLCNIHLSVHNHCMY